MGHLYHGYVSHNQMVRIGHLSQWPIDVSHSASSSATAPFVQCGWLVLHVARGNEGWFHSGFHGHLDGIHPDSTLLMIFMDMRHDVYPSEFQHAACFSMCCWCPGGPGRIPSTICINSKLDLTTVGMFDIYMYVYWYHDRETDSNNHDISNHDIIQR